MELPKLNANKLNILIASILEDENVLFCELFSEIDSELKYFKTGIDFQNHFNFLKKRGDKWMKLAIFYPETESKFKISKEDVFSKYSGGPIFRYLISGIGLIILVLYLNEDSSIDCRIDVNQKPNDIEIIAESNHCNWSFLEQKVEKLISVINKQKIN